MNCRPFPLPTPFDFSAVFRARPIWTLCGEIAPSSAREGEVVSGLAPGQCVEAGICGKALLQTTDAASPVIPCNELSASKIRVELDTVIIYNHI